MKKKERGSSDICVDLSNEILALRWNDNSVVTLLTNFLKHEPIHSAKRFDRKNKKYVKIDMPNPIFEYNRTMGGVDLFDNAINNYRIRIRGKKWYWPLFTNNLDAAMVNAWKLHCLFRKFENKNFMHQLEFRVFVAESLLQSATIPIKQATAVARVSTSSVSIRYDRVDHNVVRSERRARCRYCQNQTIFECSKCGINLHPKCFSDYHTMP